MIVLYYLQEIMHYNKWLTAINYYFNIFSEMSWKITKNKTFYKAGHTLINYYFNIFSEYHEKLQKLKRYAKQGTSFYGFWITMVTKQSLKSWWHALFWIFNVVSGKSLNMSPMSTPCSVASAALLSFMLADKCFSKKDDIGNGLL